MLYPRYVVLFFFSFRRKTVEHETARDRCETRAPFGNFVQWPRRRREGGRGGTRNTRKEQGIEGEVKKRSFNGSQEVRNTRTDVALANGAPRNKHHRLSFTRPASTTSAPQRFRQAFTVVGSHSVLVSVMCECEESRVFITARCWRR